MKLSLHIAGRYLFAKKSHNVINLISAISSAAMAVGAAVLVVIMSIFNGFDELVKTMMSSIEPDIVIAPVKGKFFVPEGEVYDWMYDNPKIKTVCTVLKDRVFIDYEGRQATVDVMGVDEVYSHGTPLAARCNEGEWYLRKEEVPYAAVGVGFASSMRINPRFLSDIVLYYPERGAKISAANPMGAVNSLSVWPSCTFKAGGEADSKLIIIDRQAMCELTGCTDEVSGVEIRLADGSSAMDIHRIKKEILRRLPADSGLQALDRAQQNPDLYRMLRYEKTSVVLIMIFVVIILGFSIFGSMSMLIIEKREDIFTLEAMGADKDMIRRIFTLEGWLITLLGMAAGLAVGIAATLLQEHFGIVKMPGSFIVEAYPVVLKWSDVAVCTAIIAAIGYLVARLSSRRLK